LQDIIDGHEEALRKLRPALRAARQRITNPTTHAWARAKPLLIALDSAPDPVEARERLCAALAKIVAEIRLLVVRRGHTALAIVQVFFVDGVRARTYLMMHRQGRGKAGIRPDPVTSCRSYPGRGEIDLRKPADVQATERFLQSLPIE
jgi:hypothetical protein